MIQPPPTLLIFADTLSPRLAFVLDFIFKSKGQPYSVINSLQEVDAPIAIGYSKQKIETKLSINPCGLLLETGIENGWTIEFNNQKAEWLVNGIKDDFAIIFYFLSRYEEYTDQNRDGYGRYTAQQSVLYKAKQLQNPVCDELVMNIWHQLGIDTKPKTDQFRTVLTYDIDIAWAYKYKPKWRTLANLAKSALNPKHFMERWKVLTNMELDPYDSYDLIEENALNHQTILFFLLGDYGQLDKNHHWKNRHLHSLIQSLQNKIGVGIHPSFNSFLKKSQIKKEIGRLKSITEKTVQNSRQHYLRFSLPESYQILLSLGITHDYSMGYAEHFGFRAGTSFPFPFFDLSSNKETTLTIVPFSVMDGTLKEYMKLSPTEAIQVVLNLKKRIQLVGGQFIPIWHNHSIADQKEWAGWQVVHSACIP